MIATQSETTNIYSNDTSPHPMRIRIKFAKLTNIRFIGHLDLFRAWERTLRRANRPIKYSLGYNPRPKINLASALPLGITSSAEIIDIILDEKFTIQGLKDKINKSLPPGIAILKVFEIPIDAPKLQKEILFAEYIATLETSLNPNIIDSLIHSDSIIQTRRGKTYDLRPLIIEIKLLPTKNQKQSRIYLKLLAISSSPEKSNG